MANTIADSLPRPAPPLPPVGRYPQGFNPNAAPVDRGTTPFDLGQFLSGLATPPQGLTDFGNRFAQTNVGLLGIPTPLKFGDVLDPLVTRQVEGGALGGPQYQLQEALGSKNVARPNPNADIGAAGNVALNVAAGAIGGLTRKGVGAASQIEGGLTSRIGGKGSLGVPGEGAGPMGAQAVANDALAQTAKKTGSTASTAKVVTEGDRSIVIDFKSEKDAVDFKRRFADRATFDYRPEVDGTKLSLYVQAQRDIEIAKQMANTWDMRLGTAPADALAQTAQKAAPEVAPRYVVDVGKTRSLIKDTQTGETLPTIYMGANHAADAAAATAKRNSLHLVSDGATKTAAAIAPADNPLRKLSTAQLGALHGVTQNPQDLKTIEALLGERAFSIAPKDQLAAAVIVFDRKVATNIRRSQRGIESDLTGVEPAINKAIKDAGLEPSPANRTAVLQAVMDKQAATNAKNPLVNGSRAAKTPVAEKPAIPPDVQAISGGKEPPLPPDVPPVAPPPSLPPVPPEVEDVVGTHGVARDIFESVRSLLSFVDIGLGRQGIRIVGNPVAFAKSAVAAARGYRGGQKVVTDWLSAQQKDPLWDTIINKMKVELTSTEGQNVRGALGREEMFPASRLENAPVLGGALQHSNAAYTHGLNVARWEKAKSDLQQAQWLWEHMLGGKGPLPDGELAAIGRNVNVATGRGQLGNFRAVTGELGSAFFSPRNTVSWPQFFTDWALHLKNGNKVAAALQAKTLVTFLGFSLAALKTHEIVTGNPTETNPTSSDFLKIVSGDQRLDIMGGGQQWMVALARMATGKTTSLSGETTATTPGDVLGAFVMNRTHPAIGAAMDIGNLGLTTANRAIEGKPFTGTAKDAQGNEYGILEVLLGATTPIVVQGFIDAMRFEMAHDKKYLDAAAWTVPQLLGFGGGRYRAGVKTPPLGGTLGSSTPEIPLSPSQILLSGQLQKQQATEVANAKVAAISKLVTTPDYQKAPDSEKVTMRNKATGDASNVANKAFGLKLALNGSPDESKQGALVAWSASPSNGERARLIGLLESSGKLTPETTASIDIKRTQTDPAKPNYDLSVADYSTGSKLMSSWLSAPAFAFGNKEQWSAAARGAELLRKVAANDERIGVKPSEDQHIDDLYTSLPFVADYYSRSGSRISKYVSPQRKAIEQNLLWKHFSTDAAKADK